MGALQNLTVSHLLQAPTGFLAGFAPNLKSLSVGLVKAAEPLPASAAMHSRRGGYGSNGSNASLLPAAGQHQQQLVGLAAVTGDMQLEELVLLDCSFGCSEGSNRAGANPAQQHFGGVPDGAVLDPPPAAAAAAAVMVPPAGAPAAAAAAVPAPAAAATGPVSGGSSSSKQWEDLGARAAAIDWGGVSVAGGMAAVAAAIAAIDLDSLAAAAAAAAANSSSEQQDSADMPDGDGGPGPAYVDGHGPAVDCFGRNDSMVRVLPGPDWMEGAAATAAAAEEAAVNGHLVGAGGEYGAGAAAPAPAAPAAVAAVAPTAAAAAAAPAAAPAPAPAAPAAAAPQPPAAAAPVAAPAAAAPVAAPAAAVVAVVQPPAAAAAVVAGVQQLGLSQDSATSAAVVVPCAADVRSLMLDCRWAGLCCGWVDKRARGGGGVDWGRVSPWLR